MLWAQSKKKKRNQDDNICDTLTSLMWIYALVKILIDQQTLSLKAQTDLLYILIQLLIRIDLPHQVLQFLLGENLKGRNMLISQEL